MLLNNKKVAIIGAGPVGLTMARLLQQSGVQVTVYERDKDAQARIWGGTLDLHEGSGQPAMKQAGLLDSYYALAIPMGRTLADEQGNVFFTREPATDTPEINRNNLRMMLLGSLASDTVIWDRKFTGLDQQDGKWLLHFDNAMSVTADLVIGANGGTSQVRRYVTDAVLVYTGTYMIQGEVLEPETTCRAFYDLCNNNIFMVSAQGLSLVANPNNNGALTYNVIIRKPEEWIGENGQIFQHTDSTIAFLSNMCADWGEVYKQLFKATSYFAGLPIRKLPLDKSWEPSRPLPVTLIGDAAHVMPPFAGQGANTGLKDALVLFTSLTSGRFDTIEAAINDYEQQMFVYATAAQIESCSNELEMDNPDFSFKKRFTR